MAAIRVLTASILLASLAAAQGTSAAVEDAVKHFQQQTAKVEGPLRVEFQLTGAQALQPKYPKLSYQLVDPILKDIRAGKQANLNSGAVRALASAAPEDTFGVLELLPRGSRQMVIYAQLEAHRLPDAVTVFRDGLAHGELAIQSGAAILKQLVKDDPTQAKNLFQQIVIGFPATASPYDAWQMIDCAETMQKVDPKDAAEVYERILAAASKPDYADGKMSIKARFATFETADSRDTLLVAAGSRLRALAPDKAEKFSEVLAKWDLSQPAVAKGLSFSNAGARPEIAPEIAAISKRSAQLRGNVSDPERAKLAMEVAAQIDGLLASDRKLNLARGLANLSTEGDLGKQALCAVAATFAHALHENPGSANDYITLASLVRYEHVPPPAFEDPAEKAAEALLELRDQIHQTAGFTLTGLDGKTYSLAALRGKIVLLNFWATWCPPCRKEMPDMEKLSHAYGDKGLVVLAVSDEDRETVVPFIEKQKYTFPVLLDTDRKVHGAFDVEGIPKTFIFDREGRLAAQAIDMRTEAQFVELLKKAGL